MSQTEERLEKATQDRQEILDRRNDSKAGRENLYDKAIQFVIATGKLEEEEVSRLAILHSDMLIEVLLRSPDEIQYFSEKPADYHAVVAHIRDILYDLHFNRDNDYYLAMLLPPDAEDALIRRRWKDLMLVYHPDRNFVWNSLSADHTEECARRMNEVYAVFKDRVKKAAYDRHLKNPGMDVGERPSFFSKTQTKNPVFGILSKHPVATVAVLLLVSACAGLLLFLSVGPARQSTGPRAALGQEAKKHSDNQDESKIRASAVKSPEAAAAEPSLSPVDAPRLAEEIYSFAQGYTKAFEKGDLQTFLSFYSKSAVEDNNLSYDRINEVYEGLFEKQNKRSYHIANMVIREEGEIVFVNAIFVMKKQLENGADSTRKGTIKMTLERRNGKLKIIRIGREFV